MLENSFLRLSSVHTTRRRQSTARDRFECTRKARENGGERKRDKASEKWARTVAKWQGRALVFRDREPKPKTTNRISGHSSVRVPGEIAYARRPDPGTKGNN